MASWDTMLDPLASNPRMQYLYTGRLQFTPFEDLKNSEADDWGLELQKKAEKEQKIRAWIQGLFDANPEWFVDHNYVLAQPKVNLKDEQEFPALPPPKAALVVPQKSLKESPKKTTKTSHSPADQNTSTTTPDSNTHNKPAHADEATKIHKSTHKSYASAARSSNDANDASQQQTVTSTRNNNPWNRPLTPPKSTAPPFTDANTNGASPSPAQTTAPIISPLT